MPLEAFPKIGNLGLLTEKMPVVLVGCFRSALEKPLCLESLEELKGLAKTFGYGVLKTVCCPLKEISSYSYLGRGKVEELKILAEKEKFSLFIFDDELSPNQQRNLEQELKAAVIDRTELIIGVFAKRAQTKEARLQVALAGYEYELPRLKRLWTHLSRQRTGGGGGGYLKGEGERQLEIDKRIIKSKIACLKKKLEEIKKQRDLKRKQRVRKKVPTFAIVGYTNAGKSTLLKALTKREVLIEDKLFATLDTTAGRVRLAGGIELVFIDTVGFIRKLPHTLIAAFRSTLEELNFADFLIHLIDLSHPAAERQAESALEVVRCLKAADKPMITVLNKADLVKDPEKILKFKIKYPFTVALSALKQEGLEALVELVKGKIASLYKMVKLKIPQSHYKLAAFVMQNGRVVSQEYAENDLLLEVEIPSGLEKKLWEFKVLN
jgi:GTP-binding protein HflX